MSTPNQRAKASSRNPKRKQPMHNTPPSNAVEKKTKSATNIEEDVRNDSEVCLVCDCVIVEPSETTEGQEAVFCEGNCQGWLHRACAGLTRPAFDNLDESMPYLCSHCTFTKQYNEICELKETVKVLTSKVAKLEGSQTPSPEYQPVNAPSGSAKPSQNSVKNLPKSQPLVPPDRKLNVVVYGLKENPSNTNRQERLQMDVKNVISSFSQLENPISESSIKDCYRLGKYNAEANRPRPILVKFLRYTDVSNILYSKSKLSKPVYVKPDLSAEERAMESLLLKERRSLIEKGIGRQFIKIRNQSLFVFNKLHAKIQDRELQQVSAPSTTVHVSQDAEQESN